MSPHQLVAGFFAGLPYAMLIAIVTLISWFLSDEPKSLIVDRTGWLIVIMMGWLSVTSLFALAPREDVYDAWLLTEKMFFFCLVTLALTNSRRRMNALIWVIVLSIGYFGFKGAAWVLITGGGNRIYGPPESQIGDNNDLGCALVMILPLILYLRTTIESRFTRLGMVIFATSVGISTLFTYSRGALVGLCAMALFLVLRGKQKVIALAGIGIAVVLVLQFAPQSLLSRWGTIETYQQDASAESRLSAWQRSWAIGLERPITGAGLKGTFFPDAINGILARHGLPLMTRARDAHSIWFQTLQETGFVGVALFILVCIIAWRNAALVSRTGKRHNIVWADGLGRMLQVSLVGFLAAGSFATLARYDGYWGIVMLAAIARRLVRTEMTSRSADLAVTLAEPKLTDAKYTV